MLNATSQGRTIARNSYKQQPKKRIRFSFIFPKFPPIHKLFGIVLSIILGLVLMVGLYFGMLILYDAATSSAFFNTKYIEVTGNKRLSKQMVVDISGVRIGENSLDVNLTKVEYALLKTPWVKKVSVRRVLPAGFVIDVQERLPVFWVRKNNILYYADVLGVIIAPVETKHFISLPTLEVEAGFEDVLPKLAHYLEELKNGYLPVEYNAISAIKISGAKGMELYLDDRDILLSIALDSFEKNLLRLSITIGDLVRRNELSYVKEVRATDGNVWVIKNV